MDHPTPEPALIAESVVNFDDAEDPTSAIFQALGAASVCWETLEHAGVFDSTRAKAIGDALIARLAEFGIHIDGSRCTP